MTELSRRTFLHTAAAGSLAAAAFAAPAPSAAAEQPPKRKFTRDLNCGMIGVRASLPEAVRLAHQYGFESVAPTLDALAKLPDGECDELLADLKAKKLAWGAAGLPVNFRGDEGQFSAGLQALPALAKAAQRAGVGRISTFLSPTHASLTYLANFRQHARRLREVAKVLADHGGRLGLEYVGPKTSWTAGRYPFLHTMAEMKDLIAEIAQPNVGFLLDSWHWHHAGETQADLLSLRNHDVVACHLNDAPADTPKDEQKDGIRDLPCATGVIDLKGFLGGLLQIGYDGPVCAEPFSKALRAMPPEQALTTTAAAMKKAFALVE
jgi:sugar phosphate isomerase/epimerase